MVAPNILARLIHGTKISLSIGFVAVGISLVIGVFFGAIAGYYGGIVDILIMRFVEIMMCFPSIFLILTIIAYMGRSIYLIMIIIGLTGWMGKTRLIRGEFFKIRETEYVASTRALGASDKRIISQHILPNAITPVLVSAAFGVAGASPE